LTKKISKVIIYLIFLKKAKKEVVMNLSPESVGHGKYHHQVRISPKSSQALDVQTSKPKNPQIKKCIKRLSANWIDP